VGATGASKTIAAAATSRPAHILDKTTHAHTPDSALRPTHILDKTTHALTPDIASRPAASGAKKKRHTTSADNKKFQLC